MTITNSNIASESFNQIKTFLNSLSLDPRKRDRHTLVHSSLPNVNAKGFDGYPFITVKVDINEENKSLNRNTSTKVFRALLTIYDPESTVIDTISDSIMANFKDDTKLVDFETRELSSSSMNWSLDTNGKKIVNRTVGFLFRKRI